MKELRNLLFGAAMACVATGWAVPAKRLSYNIIQPDGTSVTLQRAGDEFFHYYLTDDRRMVLERDGGFYFAEVGADGMPAASEMLASDTRSRTEAQRQFLNRIDEKKMAIAVENRVMASPMRKSAATRSLAPRNTSSVNPSAGIGLFPNTTFPVKGDAKVLIILVEYTDVKFKLPDPYDYFHSMLTQPGFDQYDGKGSAKDWFDTASMGQFNPQFDVYGPVTLPHNRSYYGANDYWGDDKSAYKMVPHAINILDDEVDFSQYDNDGDGYLDNVFIFYAGEGEAGGGGADTVWPHAWELSAAGASYKVDGVTVDRYGCTCEMQSRTLPDGVGTFIHEFSHVMGLPDLYDTAYSGAATPDAYSILDYGPYNDNGHTPPTYSVFERNALGWIECGVIDGPDNLVLEPIIKSNKAYIILTAKKNEFFLLENRQQESWDKSIPGHGMLIWHIDYDNTAWSNNTVNNNANHQRVDIEEACGRTYSNAAGQSAYTFPGTMGVTSFTSSTKPALKTWSGTAIDLPITDIEEVDGVISFKVAGGILIDTPVTTEATDVTTDSFVANWDPVDGATDYRLTVEIYTDHSLSNAECDFGSSYLELPEGWTSRESAAYTTTGNYGKASPSFKFGNNGAWLSSPVFDADITSLTFWCKGNSTVAATKLTILNGDANSTDELFVVDNLSTNKAQTVTFDEFPAGVRQITFKYTKSVGNCAIDDIVIGFGDAANSVLPDYDGISTAGQTSVLVDKLPEGYKKFAYTVVAVGEDDVISNVSEPKVVELAEDSGIADLTVAGCALSVSVDGRRIEVAGADSFTVTDLTGRNIASRGGKAIVPAPGVYIVAASGRAAKVIVK